MGAAFNTFSIMPQMGNLNSVCCTSPTTKGNIEVSIHKQEGIVEMNLSIPGNTIATVGVPKAGAGLNKAYCNNNLVNIKKSSNKKMKGIHYLGEDESYILFQVMPGKWKFIVQKK
jgi:hypothetical protein